ncbi:unnamed protein product [Cylindrotheca closterium]|uniref:Uncharacterized protein n=1 Tax=Cylindrotheca closterium TaxID=2856 RepID=A0AAD2FJ65_9STRA|nr:unnamed protein product [Cylindrotheca closterium]
MASTVGIVIIAAAQSVAKAFTIGLVGYVSVKFPKDNPFLPQKLVGTFSRFTFHTLMLSLIYGTIARAITLESIGDYWYVVVGAFFVLGISYVVATIMQCLIPIANVYDFRALRISVTFPNIVALPILIFPSLCEFPLVHNGYMRAQFGDDGLSPEEMEEKCVEQANTLIFCYFFGFMFLFWGVGYPQLIGAAQEKALEASNASTKSEESRQEEEPPSQTENSHQSPSPVGIDAGEADQQQNEENSAIGDTRAKDDRGSEENRFGVFSNTINACKKTFTSPGFIASILGFITACIPPLQRALFEAEAPLRFLGSAIEALGTASSSMSTIIVAASLVPPKDESDSAREVNTSHENGNVGDLVATPTNVQGDRRARITSLRHSISSRSIRMVKAMTRSTPEMRRLYLWFCLSRLVVAPAFVVGIVLALDCGFHVLDPVPNLALLVVIVNSCLPGASIIVVLLKSQMVLEETATVVAKVYFVCYIVCIFTIAAWTAVGLYITIPDEDGNTFCSRQ